MNKHIMSLLLALMSVALTSCGYDIIQDRRQLAPGMGGGTGLVGKPPQTTNKFECKASTTQGCLSGQVVVSPFIYLDSHKYFDAEDLGQVFTDLVVVRSETGNTLSKDNFVININPKITNDTFLEEFAVYIKGDSATNADLSSKGDFMLRGLDAGQYDIRVQKSFTMTLQPKEAATKPAAKTGDATASTTHEATPAAQPTPKAYCFTIYAADSQVRVEPGITLHRVFDHFKLHMMDRECKNGDEQKGPIITMRP